MNRPPEEQGAMDEARDATTLTLSYEGFLQCRLATDPDPPSERRGISGYTFALPGESDLDQEVHLQLDEIAPKDFRQPFPPYLAPQLPFGVLVNKVKVGGDAVAGHALEGAAVRWLDGAKFEIRNQIVADGFNRIAPVVDPFVLEISGRDSDAYLRRSDPLDPERPELEIWQLRPEQYRRRVASNFFEVGSEVIEHLFEDAVEANGSVDAFYNAYFQARKEWLQLRITELQARLAAGQEDAEVPLEVQIQGLETRIFSIDEHTSTGGPDAAPGRMEDRLGLQTVWDFEILGRDGQARGIPGGKVLTDRPWRTRFWVGGWDGDLLLGYLKGKLWLPFMADGSS